MRLLRHLPRFREAYKSLGELEARERWTRAEVERHQLARLNELWPHATAHVSYYRELSRSAKVPARFSCLDEFRETMPVLPKGRVRAARNDFVSAKPRPGKWHVTGGSTGAPTTVYRSHEAHREMLRARYRFHASWGVDIFDRWVFLWGHSASFAPGLPGLIDRVRRPIDDWMRNRLRVSSYHLGRKDLRAYLKKIAAFDPAIIYAYSTAGYLLAQEAEQMGLRFPSLKAVNLTAEPAFPHIVEAVERAFGVPAIIEYGSVECGFLAGEARDRTLRIREDNVLLESTPRADGRFDILVTVLNNPSFPLLRYAIGDVTDQPIRSPELGFSILSNVGGRDNDLIFSTSGEPVHCLWFDDVIEYHSAVRRYRIHQHTDGSLVVTIELTEPGAHVDVDALRATLMAHVGYPITFEMVNELPKTSAGKHRWISSDLAVATYGDQRHEIPLRAANQRQRA